MVCVIKQNPFINVNLLMRKFLQNIFTKPAIAFANRVSSRPDKKRVDKALSDLYDQIKTNKSRNGLALLLMQQKINSSSCLISTKAPATGPTFLQKDRKSVV